MWGFGSDESLVNQKFAAVMGDWNNFSVPSYNIGGSYWGIILGVHIFPQTSPKTSPNFPPKFPQNVELVTQKFQSH